MRKLLLSTLLLVLPLLASAYDIKVENEDGVMIYYNYYNNRTELEVTYGTTDYNSYSGVIKIPDEVTYMSRPRKVTSIGEKAFYNCYNMTSLTLPNTITRISDYAFYNCYGLHSLPLPEAVDWIGSYSFYNCNTLTSLTIPSSVTTIGEWAFASCCEVTSLTIPNYVASIKDYTFNDCYGLTSVTIGSSVTSIGANAFSGCSGLTTLTIPDAVTSIGEHAFSSCSSLKSVTIGNSVSTIGDYAFGQCSRLTTVISKMESPCTINSGCFHNNVYDNATLFVPDGTKKKYKNTKYWSRFVFVEEGVASVTSVNAPTERIPVLISARDGFLTVKSELEGQSVSVYTVDGKALGSARVKGGQAVIATNLPKGAIVVVKVGDRSVKALL